MTFLALALSASLQVGRNGLPDLNEPMIQSAIAQVATSETLFLQLTGNTTFKGKTIPIVSNLSWSIDLSGAKPLIQVELQEFSNSVLAVRMVGDGETFYTYDFRSHEFSTTSYGGYGDTRPKSYQSDILNHVNWAAKGPSAFVAKLTRQAFNQANTYISWMPGVQSLNLMEGVPYRDPVNGNVTYMPTASDFYYLYDGSPKRSIVFEVVPQTQSNGNPPINVLGGVFLNQIDQLGQDKKYTQWKIVPYSGFTFSVDVFKPYSAAQIQGWRQVIGPKPVTNN